jgi:hypothetical protein
MRVKGCLILLSAMLLGALGATRVQASFITVDAFSLTNSAHYGTNLNLPQMSRPQGMTLMPFYLQLNFTASENLNWGIELYSDNQSRLTGTAKTTPDGFYRGLRGFTDPSQNMPLYWQVYPADQHVISSWGTPSSVTNVAGGLAFYPATQRYWGTVYDKADVDRVGTWANDRPDRLVANINGLGNYPVSGRQTQGSFAYLYFATDLRNTTRTQDYVGQLVLDFFHSRFDFNTGCYVTPNPVKPLHGQRAYFNFYLSSSDSKVTIKIYNPTGYPVVTLQDTRYWDCRNSNGGLVEGGLYIYQIQVNDHVLTNTEDRWETHFISGTVVVIK